MNEEFGKKYRRRFIQDFLEACWEGEAEYKRKQKEKRNIKESSKP